MAIQRYKPEQIVTLLRQIEVSIGNGKATPQACNEAGITVQTYYRWRKEDGGLKLEQARRMKDLEKENTRLKRGEECLLEHTTKGAAGTPGPIMSMAEARSHVHVQGT